MTITFASRPCCSPRSGPSASWRPQPPNAPSAFGFWFGALLLAGAITGCGRNDIQVYRVAKETPAAQAKLPAGWEAVAPGEMRVASFRVNGKDGKMADVGVVPLPGQAGSDLANVNRWRGQVGLAAVTEGDLAKLAEPIQIAGQSAQLYEQGGTNPASGDKTRILAAILRREGTAWFFKMTGDDNLVAQQKASFVEFLKTYSFPDTSAPASASASAPPELPPSHPSISGPGTPPATGAAESSSQDKPDWQVPVGWKEGAGGQFVLTQFQLTGPDNAQAVVSVSTLAGDGGGLLANVNRWRNQITLAPFSESDLAKEIQSLDVAGGKAKLIDMTGINRKTSQKTRLLGAIVPQGGQTWFYKLMGDETVVEREKAAFTKFVQTVKYH